MRPGGAGCHRAARSSAHARRPPGRNPRQGPSRRWCGSGSPRCGPTPHGRPWRSPPGLRLSSLPERPHLDRPVPGDGVPGRHLDRLVEVGAFDQVVAAHLLPGLGEGTVGEQYLLTAHTYGGGVAARPEARTTPQQPPTVHLLEPGEALRIGPHLFRILHGGLVLADHQHVAHRSSLSWLLHHYDERERPESTRRSTVRLLLTWARSREAGRYAGGDPPIGGRICP